METILRQIIEATAARDTERVEVLVNTLVDVHAEDWDAHLIAANTYLWLGQKEKAYLHAAIALALNPHAPTPYTL